MKSTTLSLYISGYDVEKAMRIRRIERLMHKAGERTDLGLWNRLYRERNVQASVLGSALAHEIAMATAVHRENEVLREENKELLQKLEESQAYAEYMEYSSISTDDQPRPKGWEAAQ